MSEAVGGKLAANIIHFVRVLRRAGLPVGPKQALDAVRAVALVGVRQRDDFYHALSSVLLTRRDQRDIFDQAFQVFWRNPKFLERMIGLMLPGITNPEDEAPQLSPRVAEALQSGQNDAPPPEKQEIELDAALTLSRQEKLQSRDFEKMSLAELAAAKAIIARMRLSFPPLPTRRLQPDRHGHRLDGRATLRASLRTPGQISLRFAGPREKPPPLVILCDISGSMERYSRLLLHFIHAITSDQDRVAVFLFGTRLTNITRSLRYRDVDAALGEIGRRVQDWSGGTRIGDCLHDFNRLWSRRVLGQGATVLLITDGLDKEAGIGLAPAAERLAKSCRRLIWLNPLLRFDGFQARAAGVRTLLPYVDEFRPVHNLDSLAALATALTQPAGRRGSRNFLREYGG